MRVWAPASRWTKTGLLARALDHCPEMIEWVRYTRSCYDPEEDACDRCPACFRRAVAEFHCGLRRTRPRLPFGVDASAGWAAARTAGPARLPAVAVNNATAALALAGVRLHAA